MKQSTSVKEHLLFFRKFLQKGTLISSFWPSSKTLALALCRDINPQKPQIILELGAGTGPITVVASEKMHPESTLISIEQDPELSQFLKARCPKAIVIPCGAEAMLGPIQALGINQVDVIISTLPIPSLPKNVVHTILANCKVLMQKDIPFSQVTIIPWVFLKVYKEYFEQVDFEFVLKSIPPGGVYRCFHLKG